MSHALALSREPSASPASPVASTTGITDMWPQPHAVGRWLVPLISLRASRVNLPHVGNPANGPFKCRKRKALASPVRRGERDPLWQENPWIWFLACVSHLFFFRFWFFLIFAEKVKLCSHPCVTKIAGQISGHLRDALALDTEVLHNIRRAPLKTYKRYSTIQISGITYFVVKLKMYFRRLMIGFFYSKKQRALLNRL
jgi:hypothetical protein